MSGVIYKKAELINVLEKCGGCIIYGAGLVGTCMVQYLIKEKLSSKVICIGVKSKMGNPESLLGIPVYELCDLEAYKEKYFFLIATLEHLQTEIRDELEAKGYKNIFGITNTFYANIREEVNDFTPDILCMLHKGLKNIYDHFYWLNQKLEQQLGQQLARMQEELPYLIEEQNEISNINTRAFAKYRNCYRGKDIVIAATGPTLNDYQPMEEAIHIGVNTTYKKRGLNLDYLFVQDGRPEFLQQGKFEGIENVKCKIFMGRMSKRSHSEYIEFPEEYRLHENVKDFFLDHAWTEERIYQDICRFPLAGGYSVIFSAFHFALYTYPQKIYLVGCDNAPTGYYDGHPNIMMDTEVASQLKFGYLAMKKFAKIHYPETEIVSINPIGLKGIFKDIYTK